VPEVRICSACGATLLSLPPVTCGPAARSGAPLADRPA